MKKSVQSSSSSVATTTPAAVADSQKTVGGGIGKVVKSGRQPLTPIENRTSRSSYGIMGKPSPASVNDKKLGPKNDVIVKKGQKSTAPSNSSAPAAAAPQKTGKAPNGSLGKKKAHEDKEVQTDGDNNIEMITSDVPSIEYWKELAEERRVALEEALEENKLLSEKVAKLEQDNKELEEIVEESKQLAEMIQTISEDPAYAADESGIGKDADESTL